MPDLELTGSGLRREIINGATKFTPSKSVNCKKNAIRKHLFQGAQILTLALLLRENDSNRDLGSDLLLADFVKLEEELGKKSITPVELRPLKASQLKMSSELW
ncbi:uncharacterized protein V6R79_006331, partial [Siganus canaliculatus]